MGLALHPLPSHPQIITKPTAPGSLEVSSLVMVPEPRLIVVDYEPRDGAHLLMQVLEGVVPGSRLGCCL